jgi:hypothetical protein
MISLTHTNTRIYDLCTKVITTAHVDVIAEPKEQLSSNVVFLLFI